MKIFTTLLGTLVFAALSFAQVNIGGNAGTSESILMDFGTDPKAVVMPRVNNSAGVTIGDAIEQQGTIVYDYSEGCFKVYTSGGWSSCPTITGIRITQTGSDIAASETIVGSDVSGSEGALILKSPNEDVVGSPKLAMVLPKIQSVVTSFGSGKEGMMVYDTTNKCVRVSDGFRWRCILEAP